MGMSTATNHNGRLMDEAVIIVKRLELTIKLWMQAWPSNKWTVCFTPATSGGRWFVDGRIPAGSANTWFANSG